MTLNNESCIGDSINTFLKLFTEIASNNENIALICQKKSYSYSELNALSNQYANYFLSQGISANDYVGVCLDRNEHLLPSVLGLLKLGAAYIPLDPGFPFSRLNYMVEDSGLRHIVSQSNHRNIFEEQADKNFIAIDLGISEIAKESKTLSEVSISGNNLAYVIYTSGSTGKPKGVQIQHKALLNFLLSMKNCPGISSEDRMLALTTLSFDISGLELFLPLIAGASIVLASAEQSKNPTLLMELVKKHNVTIMQATPATYHMLVDAGWTKGSVSKILCGGEALSQDLATKLLACTKEVWNMYGPTETTIWSTVYQVNDKNQKPLIGKPIRNTTIYLLDESLHPVKDGEIGDLYIGGDGLSLGYLNRPDLNSDRFLKIRLQNGHEERIYKTGDLCRKHVDGNLEYMGRSDFQVKIRGFRIELGEIEHRLVQDPSIHSAVVVAREDLPGRKRLVAFFVEEKGKEFSAIKIKEYLSTTLPAYMVPEVYIPLESYPLTPNGKVDRKSLEEMNILNSGDGQVNPPSTVEEKIISGIYEDVLGIQIDDVNVNYLDLGGDSLTSMQVLLKLQNILGIVPSDWERINIYSLAVMLKESENKEKKLVDHLQLTPLAPDILFRAFGIISIVALHLGWYYLPLKTNIPCILFLLAGFSFGKFLLPQLLESESTKRLGSYVFKVVISSLPILLFVFVMYKPHYLSTILFYSNFYDYPSGSEGGWIYLWFIACYIQIFLIVWGLFSFKQISVFMKKNLFASLSIFFITAFLLRFLIPGVYQFDLLIDGMHGDSVWAHLPTSELPTVFLGALVAVADKGKENLVCLFYGIIYSLAVYLVTPGNGFIPFTFVLAILLYVAHVPIPRLFVRPIILVSGASLYIYLIHPIARDVLYEVGLPHTAYLISILAIAISIFSWKIWEYFQKSLWRYAGNVFIK